MVRFAEEKDLYRINELRKLVARMKTVLKERELNGEVK